GGQWPVGLIIVGVFVLGVSLLVLAHVKPIKGMPLGKELVRDLGIGCLVSALVGGTVDQFRHSQERRENREHIERLEIEHKENLKRVEEENQQQLDKVTKDVFKAAFGVVLDERLRKEIGDTIFQYPHLVRENLTLTYEFEDAQDAARHPDLGRLL